MTNNPLPEGYEDAPSIRELSQRARRVWLSLILTAYGLVTLLYGVVNPLFEAPDEHWHYFTVQYITENWTLPSVAPGDTYDEWMSQEAAQPPLYYLAGAVLTAPIDTSSARSEVWFNKFASIGDASALININRFVHTETESWPWQGYALAAHILRGLSTLLGMGTLICIYLGGRLLWPSDPYRALLATALVAFLPQYNFAHASVSNDPLIIFLVSLALWQLIRLWETEVTRSRLLMLGLTIGLATLSKNQGIALLVYASGVLALLAIRESTAGQGEEHDGQRTPGGWRLIGATALFVVLPAVGMGLWLWARNWSLYGDITAMNQFIRIAGGDRNYALWQVLRESRGLWLSLFAVFGWFNLRAPNWVTWFWSGLVILAVVGGSWSVMTRSRPSAVSQVVERNNVGFWQWTSALLRQQWVLPLLLTLWVVAVYTGLILFMMQTEAAQGRLLFPGLLPLSLGMAAGLTAIPWLRRVSPAFAFLAFLITLYCLFYVVRPVYDVPPMVIDLPPEAQELDVDMGQGIRLIGAMVESDRVLPGEPLWLTLYWRGDNVRKKAPEFVLSVFGRDNEEIGKVHSYHGRGLYPAGLWPDGQIVADRFGLWIDGETIAPVLASIDSTILAGETARVGEIKIEPQAWPGLEDVSLARFGPAIDLLNVQVSPEGAKPGDIVTLDILWQARDDMQTDLTTLVHLGQPDAPPLATGDRPPLNGRYPTRVWENGEQVDDHYELSLPHDLARGRYPLWIGMYDSKTMDRLPITIAGEQQPYNVYLAGWIEVE